MAAAELVAGLRIRHNGLTLRPALEDDVDALMLVYSDDFDLGSSKRQPQDGTDTVRDRMLNRIRRHRRFDSIENWRLEFVVEAEPDAVLGWATLSPDDFSGACKLETTSWVAKPFRRQGHATSIREAMLSLAFDGLGASATLSRVQPGNAYSSRICQKLGYEWAAFSRTEDPRIAFDHWELSRPEWQDAERNVELLGCHEFRAWLNSGSAS